MVQMRAISKTTTENLEARFAARAAELRARVATRIADAIVDGSPVDTGTYIMAHVAGVGSSSDVGTRSSHGKPRGRNAQQFQNLARGNLKRSVSAQAIIGSSEIWFRNRAIHAARVEYLGWGMTPAYHVYANARARVPEFIRDAVNEMRMTAR